MALFDFSSSQWLLIAGAHYFSSNYTSHSATLTGGCFPHMGGHSKGWKRSKGVKEEARSTRQGKVGEGEEEKG